MLKSSGILKTEIALSERGTPFKATTGVRQERLASGQSFENFFLKFGGAIEWRIFRQILGGVVVFEEPDFNSEICDVRY